MLIVECITDRGICMVPLNNREEAVIVLDFLKNGYIDDPRPAHKKEAVVQGIGVTTFSLFELVSKKDIFLQPGQIVYIGEGKRDEIHHIVGKMQYDRLTNTAHDELEFVVKDLVNQNEKKFVDYFNTAQPLTMRMHQLELLPGLGKKHMWEIVEQREQEPFKSFEDIKTRVKLIPDPQKLVIKRILLELEGNEKYRIFVKD
jgi:putative nucleotide binding protein